MKICYILTEIANGGAERIVFELSSYFRANNHEVTLISLQPIEFQNPMYLEFKSLDIRILSLNLSSKKILNIFKLNKIVNSFDFDVIHSHLFHGNILSRFIRRDRSRCKLINTIHIMEYRKLAFWRFYLDRLTFNRCDEHTAVAYATAEFHAKKLHVAINKIKVVKNGIKIAPQLSDSEIYNFKKEHNLLDYDYIVGSVGRLDYQKGYDRLLNLLSEISAKIPVGQKWAIVIIGDGSEREKLMSLAKNAPENLQVYLLGFFANANQLNIIFDLLVIPSRSEGYSLILLEAMRNGVAVLLNRVSCVVETLDDYPNGEIIDYFNDEKDYIADKIVNNTLSSKKIEYTKISTIENMALNYLKLYANET